MALRDKFNTGYFSEEIVRAGVQGCCHDVAFAIHRRTGWKIGVILRDPVLDQYTIFRQTFPTHLFCITPGGAAVDIEGITAIPDLLSLYAGPGNDRDRLRVEEFMSEKDWESRAGEIGCDSLLPREHRIAAAGEIIEKSSLFLQLLATLQNFRAAPAPKTP